jgi:hypothetical protein
LLLRAQWQPLRNWVMFLRVKWLGLELGPVNESLSSGPATQPLTTSSMVAWPAAMFYTGIRQLSTPCFDDLIKKGATYFAVSVVRGVFP